MNEVSLNAKKRQDTGKKIARALRRQGKLPAVIYGGGDDPVALELDYREFDAIVRQHRGENILFNLKVGKSKPQKALLRDIQQDFIRDNMLHADFQQISMTDRLTVDVQIVLTGHAVGVRPENGGILEQLLRGLEIECLVSDMPEHLEVDVSALQLGGVIHVRDLSFPNIEILTDGDAVVAAVVAPMREEEVLEEVAEDAVAEPEVIGRAKDDEDSEES